MTMNVVKIVIPNNKIKRAECVYCSLKTIIWRRGASETREFSKGRERVAYSMTRLGFAYCNNNGGILLGRREGPLLENRRTDRTELVIGSIVIGSAVRRSLGAAAWMRTSYESRNYRAEDRERAAASGTQYKYWILPFSFITPEFPLSFMPFNVWCIALLSNSLFPVHPHWVRTK